MRSFKAGVDGVSGVTPTHEFLVAVSMIPALPLFQDAVWMYRVLGEMQMNGEAQLRPALEKILKLAISGAVRQARAPYHVAVLYREFLHLLLVDANDAAGPGPGGSTSAAAVTLASGRGGGGAPAAGAAPSSGSTAAPSAPGSSAKAGRGGGRGRGRGRGGGGGGASGSTAAPSSARGSTTKGRRGRPRGFCIGLGSMTPAASVVAPSEESRQQHPSDILAKLFTLSGRGFHPSSDPADAHARDPSAVFKGSAPEREEVEVTRHCCRSCKRRGSSTHEPLSPSRHGSGCVLEIPVAGTLAITAEEAIEAWRSRWKRCSGCGAVGVGVGVEVSRHLASVPAHLIVRFVPAASTRPWNVQLPFLLSLGRSIKVPVSANGATTRKLRVVVVGKRTSKKTGKGGYSVAGKEPKPTGPSGNPSFLFFALDPESRDYVMQDGPRPSPVSDRYALSSTETMRVDWVICSPVDPLNDDDDRTNDEFSARGPIIDEGVTQWVGRWDQGLQRYARFSNITFKDSSQLLVRVTAVDNKLLKVFRDAAKERKKRATSAGSAEPPSSGAAGPSNADVPAAKVEMVRFFFFIFSLLSS